RDTSRVRLLEPGDAAQGRRFAATARAEQNRNLRFRELLADRPENGNVAERLREAFDLDRHRMNPAAISPRWSAPTTPGARPARRAPYRCRAETISDSAATACRLAASRPCAAS